MLNNTPPSAATAARPKDSLGCVSHHLYKDQELDAGGFRLFHKGTHDAQISAVATPASDRGLLVGVSLNHGHRRRIFSGMRSQWYEFEKDTVYIRDFSDEYRADMQGGFDFILIELTRDYLTQLGIERGRMNSIESCSKTGHKDAILGHFAQIAALVLERKSETSALFVEQLGIAVGIHLLDQYGQASSPSEKSGRQLSPTHEARAKEMLLASAHSNMSIEQIAKACNMSRSYFIRAFRETTQRTPHQWLLEQRVTHAKGLLKQTDMALSDIAITCGFADQSHFTRTFSQIAGTSPGMWRRTVRG